MRRVFPLFQSHLDLAHSYWERLVKEGDSVIDATCGNGHDTLFLARCRPGRLYAIDIQGEALEKTRERLAAELGEEALKRVSFHEGCHSILPEEVETGTVTLIVYNLGYLPQGDKSLTTETSTTLESLQAAMVLLKAGGCISITCYPGHPEGASEEKALLQFCSTLDPKLWSCCHQRWINRNQSPSLLLIQKSRE